MLDQGRDRVRSCGRQKKKVSLSTGRHQRINLTDPTAPRTILPFQSGISGAFKTKFILQHLSEPELRLLAVHRTSIAQPLFSTWIPVNRQKSWIAVAWRCI
jgi:hypothetical protein